jgi:cytidine deaminase
MKPISLLLHNIGHHDLYAIFENTSGKRVYITPKNVNLNSFATSLKKLGRNNLYKNTEDNRIIELLNPIEVKPNQLRRRFEVNSPQFKILKDGTHLVGIFFPLLPMVVDKWQNQECVQSIFLITSRPIEKSIKGTATYSVGQLSQLMMEYSYPEISCELLEPIESNPFLFESQVPYIRRHIREKVDEVRRSAVNFFGDTWAKNFTLTISASTGTTPMITALHATFRDLRPFFIHVPAAHRATTPSETVNVECYNFDTVGDIPALPIEDVSIEIRKLTEKMIEWKNEFEQIWNHSPYNSHELVNFWLRKGKKPVLAVLVVENQKGIAYFRACNVEVSLPTGTLCAERNAIGTALASDPGLKRQDIKMIAVLSLFTNDESPQHLNPLLPCGACMEWLRKIAEVNPDLKIINFTDPQCTEVFVRPVV